MVCVAAGATCAIAGTVIPTIIITAARSVNFSFNFFAPLPAIS
jgi:hypothetical protein